MRLIHFKDVKKGSRTLESVKLCRMLADARARINLIPVPGSWQLGFTAYAR